MRVAGWAIGTPALAAWLHCLASNVCETLQDHKPEVEAAWGRLTEEQLFRDNEATYSTSSYRVGNGYWDPPHRLALSSLLATLTSQVRLIMLKT